MNDLTKEQLQELNALDSGCQVNLDRCLRCKRAKVPGAEDTEALIRDQADRIALLRSAFNAPTMD